VTCGGGHLGWTDLRCDTAEAVASDAKQATDVTHDRSSRSGRPDLASCVAAHQPSAQPSVVSRAATVRGRVLVSYSVGTYEKRHSTCAGIV
jgi:hypothetical protein